MASRIVPVGGTIGIMGGGQLGRMMALAGRAMGLNAIVWDPQPIGPAHEVAGDAITAGFESEAALLRFSEGIDAATYEFENVTYETTARLARIKPVFPPPDLLYVSQNRLREKDRARQFGLATTTYRAVPSAQEARQVAADLGFPGILKTVSGAYDGKGQIAVNTMEEAGMGFQALHGSEPLIYEKKVAFIQEMSVVVARDQNGRIAIFPASENHHDQGILDWTVVPARVPDPIQQLALHQAAAMARGLGLVGVMALEFFVTAEGELLFNEMAPRPHNSGHWTIEGAWPSQFSQHMRAVAGWPVASPRLFGPCVMLNLLGDLFLEGLDKLTRVLEWPGVQLHWYGKTAMRKGRKVGHVTVLADSVTKAIQRARDVKVALGGAWHDGA